MKPATVIAFLALLLAFIATAESYYSDSSCMREMQRRSLNRCRSFMKYGKQQQQQQQSLIWTNEDDENNMQAPEECCMQLKKVSEECRCPMIRHMMKQMKQEEGFMGQECTGRCREMMMKAKFLPAMCDMEPHTCRMRQGSQM